MQVRCGLVGWRQWAGGVELWKVGWIELWTDSEVYCSLIREYQRDFSCSNTGTVITVGKQPRLFMFLYPLYS
jgi:hypothetical protein